MMLLQKISFCLLGISSFGLSESAMSAMSSKDALSVLRFSAFALTDQPPSVTEAQTVNRNPEKLKDIVIALRDKKSHRERIFRYFNDIFGTTRYVFINDEQFYLKKTSDDIYYLDVPQKGSCDAEASELLDYKKVWWLSEGDDPIRVCKDAINDFIVKGEWDTPTWRECHNTSDVGIMHEDCGCGPKMILCLPEGLQDDIMDAVRFEFPNRGVYVYEQDLSWLDLLGGDQFYGNRLLYQHYIYQQKISPVPGDEIGPTANDLKKLESLPLKSLKHATFTDFPDATKTYEHSPGSKRSGVATMPAFLRQYNNFRSRIRAITEKLLCEDVTGSLNTHGIATFVNDDLTDFDKEHGAKEECASCHFPMDNAGSTLLGWGSIGEFQYWEGLSQKGHIFGEEGEGPEFLMSSYVERHEKFMPCMAKRAFEEFTGRSYQDVPLDIQKHFETEGRKSPRSLFNSIFTHPIFYCPRSQSIATCLKQSENSAQGSQTLSFTTDIAPILAQSCGGSSCHSQGTSIGVRYAFIDSEQEFKQIDRTRISNLSMPPDRSLLSDTDRERLLNFLAP